MSDHHPVNLARLITARRGTLFLLSVITGLALSIGLLFISFNTSVGELLSESDPYLDELEEMEKRFPTAFAVNFVFTGDETGSAFDSVFNPDTLAALSDLKNRFRELPGATRLSSILDYRSPQSNTALFARPIVDYTIQELEQLRQQALDDPLLAGTFLGTGANLTFATVYIDFDESEQSERLQLAQTISAFTDDLRSAHPAQGIYVNSDVLFEESTQDAMIKDLTTLLPFVILICVLVISYSFHSFIFGACILSQALLSVVSTVGITGYSGISFNTISIIAPLIVVIISVGHSVHLISIYKQQLFNGLSYTDAMTLSVSYNLKPVLLATLTTAIGFLSLNTSSSPAIQYFGSIVALGTGLAFIYTFTLLPTLLIWVSIRTRAHGKTMDSVLPQRLVRAVKLFWHKRERTLFIGFSSLAVLTFILLPLNNTDFDRLSFIDSDTEVGKYYEIVSAGLQRGPALVYGIALDQAEGAIEPDFLHEVERFSEWLSQQSEVESTASLVEMVKTINQVRNGQDPSYYVIPSSKNAIARDLGVYQSIEFEDYSVASFIDQASSAIRLVINARPLSNQQLIDLDEKITSQFEESFAGRDAKLIHGSAIVVFARMDGLITIELLQGYLVSLFLITLTLVIGFRSFYFGLLSVLPNLLPATIVFGIWGLFVGQLDPFVLILFSISIGLVVDDTVHLLTHYLENRQRGMEIDVSFNTALDTAGPALVVTTAVLALGTTILIAANTLYFQQAAKLLVPIVVLALALDLLYLPTILKRFDRKLVQKPLP